jgi:hypothetical protein
MQNDRALEAFKADLQETQARNIERFPSLIFRRIDQQPLILSGYRPYSVLLEVLKQIYPGIEPSNVTKDALAYRSRWSSITPREIKEVFPDAVVHAGGQVQ